MANACQLGLGICSAYPNILSVPWTVGLNVLMYLIYTAEAFVEYLFLERPREMRD
jgi:hypothetical protein